MRKLRIATMVTGIFTIPQPAGIVYAPIDLMVSLVNGLTKRGHDVTVYAAEGSRLATGRLKTCSLPPLKKEGDAFVKNYIARKNEEGRIEVLWDQFLISQMFQAAQAGQYDLLHIHPVDVALSFARTYPTVPVVYTLHDPIFDWRRDLYRLFLSPNQSYVSISDAQRKPAPELPFVRTVYNGIDLADFPFSDQPGKHLLLVGRIMPEKGVAEAIAVAKQLNEKLVIIGPLGPLDYWHTSIVPQLNDQITHIGFIDRKNLHTYYKDAKAVLMPIQWEEPFGLVMTEAMACGTPVIAFRRGSVPEVVMDGQTGFIVDDVAAMAAAVQKISMINRTACRDHVQKNFSIETMIDGYEQAYYQMLDREAGSPRAARQ